jgi:hypothetical protein
MQYSKPDETNLSTNHKSKFTMRPDMHKVVAERPRSGHSWTDSLPRPKPPFDDSPRYESIMKRHTGRKWSVRLLGPLRRWLRSQLGRPWNDVYSEACAVIKPNSVVRANIKTHLLELVERHVFMHNRKVYTLVFQNGSITPLEELRFGFSLFYVHPETHLLCEMPHRPKFQWRDKNAEKRASTQRWLSESKLLRCLNGCWFECHVNSFPRRTLKGDSPWRFDLAEKKLVCRSQSRAIYGRDVFCISKRQLSRRELKKFGLVNRNTIFNTPVHSLLKIVLRLFKQLLLKKLHRASFLSCSSKAEHSPDKRGTAEHYRAGQPNCGSSKSQVPSSKSVQRV